MEVDSAQEIMIMIDGQNLTVLIEWVICAWWYNHCYTAHLNGRYINSTIIDERGIHWFHWKNEYINLEFTEMKTHSNN